MNTQTRTGLILVVAGLILTAVSVTMSRSSDTPRGIMTGIAIGLEVVGIVAIITGRRKSRA